MGQPVDQAEIEALVEALSLRSLWPGFRAALGETTETGTATVYAIGVQGTGRAGNVLVWGEIVPTQNANWTDIAA